MQQQHIFLIDEEIEKQLNKFNPNGIDWYKVFLFPLKDKFLSERFEKMICQMKIGYKFFLQGLIQEYVQKDIQQALQQYILGSQQKDSYSFFKLYYIQRYQYQEFTLERNKDKEMMFLFQSCAHYDFGIDNRFKVTPMMYLLNHIATEDQQFEKILSLAYMNEDKFIYFWISAKFNIGRGRSESIQFLESISKNNSEVSYFLAEMSKEYRQSLGLDIKYSERLYIQALQQGCQKSYYQLGNYFNQTSQFDQSIIYYQKAAEIGCFKGLYDYAILIFIQNQTQFYQEALECLINSFNLAYMFSVDDFEFLLSKIKIQVQNKELYCQILFTMAQIFLENYKLYNKNTSTLGSQYYILSHIYSKGIHVQKDIEKARDLLLQAELDPNVERKRYIKYRLGRLFANEKKGFTCQKSCFEDYEQFSHDDKYMSKFPSISYKFGIIYEQGFGVEKNLVLSQDYYERGTYRESKSALIQNYFYKKSIKAFYRLKNANKIFKSKCIVKYHNDNKEIKYLNISGIYITLHDKHGVNIYDLEKMKHILKLENILFQNQIIDVKINLKIQILMIMLRFERKILIYNLKTFKLISILPIHKDYLNQLLILDHKRIIIFDHQMVISIYDYMKRVVLHENLIDIGNNFVNKYGTYDFDESSMTLFIPDRQLGINIVNFQSSTYTIENHQLHIDITDIKLQQIYKSKNLFVSSKYQNHIWIMSINKFCVLAKFELQSEFSSFCIGYNRHQNNYNLYISNKQNIQVIEINEKLELQDNNNSTILTGHTQIITNIINYNDSIISVGTDQRVRIWQFK